MDFHKKNKADYNRVMSRVFNRSHSSLRSSSNVTRHEVPSSVRVGAKPSVSAVSSSVFSELPTVLNDYVPEVKVEKVVTRPSVRPKRTLKSLDPSKAKASSRPSRERQSVNISNIRARSSVPVVSKNNGEDWSDSHVRQCYSSRSHTRLKELKDEIKAFRNTDKLMKIRSHLYKSCGVVLDDVGNVAQDKAVQAEAPPGITTLFNTGCYSFRTNGFNFSGIRNHVRLAARFYESMMDEKFLRAILSITENLKMETF